MNRHFAMCTLYLLAIAISPMLPEPMNYIQGGLCLVLLPIRLYMGWKDAIRSKEGRR